MEEGALQVSHRVRGFEKLETSHPAGWLDSKRQKTVSAGEDVEEVGPLCTAGGNVQEDRLVLPQKTRHAAAM